MPENSAAKIVARMPEAFVSSTATSREVSRAVGAGRLRKIASRLYTRNLVDPPEAIVRRNLWRIVAGYFPGALVADRTALENAPAGDGSVCLVSDKGRDIRLPGHVLRPRRGPAPLPSDRPFVGDLFLSSTARAHLENMRPSRGRGGLVRRTLSRGEIGKRLDALVRRSGEDAANRLRDEIRAAGRALGMEREATELDALIGFLLGAREAPPGMFAVPARRADRPFDPDRMELFQALHAALRDHPPLVRVARNRGPEGDATLAFFDAYFSNVIEGVEFTVDEAVDIVFRGAVPGERLPDAHDLLGVWRIVSDARGMARTPATGEDLVRLLRARHAAIMAGRPDIGSGVFKRTRNRAGSTVFVAPDLVDGTLERGFDLHRSLETPFQRAVFIAFLVAEVHPFVDGNGRVARVMMNAELVAAGEERIVIPTAYRANHLVALKALSQSGLTDPLIRMFDYAQRWTAAVDWRSVAETRRELRDCNAFFDAVVIGDEVRRLRMPGEAGR